MNLFLILFGILFVGCAPFGTVSYLEIRRAAFRIDRSNGIDQQEAIILAQKAIIDKGLGDRLYSLKPIGLEKKIVWNKDGKEILIVDPPSETFQFDLKKTWIVLFRDRKGSQLWGLYPVIPFYVEVNLETGDIERWGLKKDYGRLYNQ